MSSKFPTRCQYNLQCHRLFHLHTSKSKAKHLQLASAFVIHIFISVTDTFLLCTKLLSSFPWMPNWYHKNIVVHSSRTLVAEVPSEEQFVTVTACSLSSQVGNEFRCWWNNVGKPTAWLERDEFIENFCFTLTWVIMKSCTCFALSNWEPQLPLCQPEANMEMHFFYTLSCYVHTPLYLLPRPCFPSYILLHLIIYKACCNAAPMLQKRKIQCSAPLLTQLAVSVRDYLNWMGLTMSLSGVPNLLIVSPVFITNLLEKKRCRWSAFSSNP